NVLQYISNLDDSTIKRKYDLPEDGRDWSIDWARKDLSKKDGIFIDVSYHPFDNRKTYFTGRSKGFMAYPRSPLSNNCIKENVSLLAIRNSRRGNVNNYFIANKLVDKDGVSPFDNCKFFPLYLYSKTNSQQTIDQTSVRVPNLNTEIVKQIAEKLGLTFMAEKENGNICFATSNDDLRDEYKQIFTPIDILDYIYAVLHSPTYREKYKEFLKIDFPRVPYPKDATTFWKLVKLGGEIRQIHLLESPVVEQYITQYPEDGDNKVTKPKYEDGKVYINASQYFANVPQVAWEFYIGGYQPAQKWLKDRKGRKLEFDDILHYQKIIVALFETDRMMKEIDAIDIEG
ncbi:MAG: type ISP restriction/modification enzyme, partial [Saprospiraceae bacterium]